MAKRRRLNPIPAAASSVTDLSKPNSIRSSSTTLSTPPIARVAEDAAREAAFEEMRRTLSEARAEGRLIQKLSLEAVVLDHMLRDRIGLDEDALAPLMESLRARGQQVPIEVMALGDGRFGLISGWRRLIALRKLFTETGEARFATVLALMRKPENAGAAYLAMVEENEIRLGLSHFERARIVARAVDAGVFPTTKIALQTLFAHGSRARRSKIGAFLGVVAALDGKLRFPTELGERLGLALAAQLSATPGFGSALCAQLDAQPPESADAERALLEKALQVVKTEGSAVVKQKTDVETRPEVQATLHPAISKSPEPHSLTQDTLEVPVSNASDAIASLDEESIPDLVFKISGDWLKPVLTISGPKIDQAFLDRLTICLKPDGIT